MKPWLRLTLTLIGLALVCLFLNLSQPVGLSHAVAGSKPWPAPGPPTASIHPSMKFDPVRARPLPLSAPRLSVDYKRTWSTWPPDSGAPGTDRTSASSRSKLAAHNELSS
jgi:hypothetical protein